MGVTYPKLGAFLNATGRQILYTCSWPVYTSLAKVLLLVLLLVLLGLVVLLVVLLLLLLGLVVLLVVLLAVLLAVLLLLPQLLLTGVHVAGQGVRWAAGQGGVLPAREHRAQLLHVARVQGYYGRV